MLNYQRVSHGPQNSMVKIPWIEVKGLDRPQRCSRGRPKCVPLLGAGGESRWSDGGFSGNHGKMVIELTQKMVI